MGYTIITSFPDVLNVKCLCFGCGMKDFPNLNSEWWSDSYCCCLFGACGVKELKTCQILPLGPCDLTSPAFKFTTSIPVSIVFFVYKSAVCGRIKIENTS